MSLGLHDPRIMTSVKTTYSPNETRISVPFRPPHHLDALPPELPPGARLQLRGRVAAGAPLGSPAKLRPGDPLGQKGPRVDGPDQGGPWLIETVQA